MSTTSPVSADKPKILLTLEGKPNGRALKTYVENGGYTAVRKAFAMKREDVIEEVKQSGLRGRGGAGFPTGLKWSFVPKDIPPPRYLICNNDESEPGTFKDRHLCTVSPHSVIEGMIIAAYAINANKGYIYTRYEFQEEIGFLEAAIKEAYEAGFLGKNVLGSGFDFDLDHYTGAGAYICGEETGLIARRQEGAAQGQAAVSGGVRLSRSSDDREQHRDARGRAVDHQQRRQSL